MLGELGSTCWTCATSSPCATAAARCICAVLRTFFAASSSLTDIRSTASKSAWRMRVRQFVSLVSLLMTVVSNAVDLGAFPQSPSGITSCWSGPSATARSRCTKRVYWRTSTASSWRTFTSRCFSVSLMQRNPSWTPSSTARRRSRMLLRARTQSQTRRARAACPNGGVGRHKCLLAPVVVHDRIVETGMLFRVRVQGVDST